MKLSHSSHLQHSNGHSGPDLLPILDLATIVGGGVLSAAGLFRGGIRGWVSTSLGTLLIYRGVVALQAHAANCAAANEEAERAMPSRTAAMGEGNLKPESISFPMKGTCTSPGIVAPF